MTTIDSHNKIDHSNTRRFDTIKAGHPFSRILSKKNKFLNWKNPLKRDNFSEIKDKIVRRKITSTAIDIRTIDTGGTLSLFEINKIDIQQRMISIIIFILIATGISLTILATSNTKNTPKELEVILY